VLDVLARALIFFSILIACCYDLSELLIEIRLLVHLDERSELLLSLCI